MQAIEHPSYAVSSAPVIGQVQYFPSLEQETRSHVGTACAAFHLIRKEQTLRAWASLENGPIRPTRVNGRLAWSVEDIKRLLNGGA